FLEISLAQIFMDSAEVGVELHRFIELIDGLIIMTAEVVAPTEVGIDDERQRIQPLRSFHLRNRFVVSTRGREVKAIPVMRIRVTWVERDRTLEILLNIIPIEI